VGYISGVPVRYERGTLPPPDPSVHTVGGEDGGVRGLKQLAILEYYGLLPSSSVLEIGCGTGRLAYELASFLDDDGRYTGADIAPKPVAWLNEHYAPRLRDFRFDLLDDIANPRYNPEGSVAQHAVRFPYLDAAFDVVCAFEVFMHVPLEGVRNYLNEIARVVKPGGVAVISFMAVWENEREPMYSGRRFKALGDGVYTRFPEKQGLSMGYSVGLLRELFRAMNFELIAELEGLWHSPFKPRPAGPVHNCDLFAIRRLPSG
jgi:SAM-dependent methyltransferase